MSAITAGWGITAARILAEVDGIGRFANEAKLASYPASRPSMHPPVDSNAIA
ncbi:hypothetical protein [Solirubrobacter deserti]|uniref:IS110 family transposase n=1 Tax=Solirubrobacter deserti TaxID=2282478 RepID=A0ABT4RG30_9ACTN|nr:hypothetical protein [Solirubrobacter deserti]MDA0137260.1 hypothetical protein [Solirubrobacter deserti]